MIITDQEGAKETACLLGKQCHTEQHQLLPSMQITSQCQIPIMADAQPVQSPSLTCHQRKHPVFVEENITEGQWLSLGQWVARWLGLAFPPNCALLLLCLGTKRSYTYQWVKIFFCISPCALMACGLCQASKSTSLVRSLCCFPPRLSDERARRKLFQSVPRLA